MKKKENIQKKIILPLTLIVLFLCGLVSSVFATDFKSQDRFIVKFKEKPDESSFEINQKLKKNTYALKLSKKDLDKLKKDDNVESIEEDVIVNILGRKNRNPPVVENPQPQQSIPWSIVNIGAVNLSNKGNGVKVCIIDTGIDKTHPDLQGNIVSGINFIGKGRKIDRSKFDDDNGHGTHVAGTIGALDNSIGVVGVAPEVDLLIVKALNSQGSGYLSDIIAGIEWCSQNGAKVISMSLGTNSDISAMKDAVDTAYQNEVLIVAAAGNDYFGSVSYPAGYDSVIAVSATDSNNVITSFSNIGPQVELSAPGLYVESTWLSGTYKTISGTSMATPHVSGVAALAYSQNMNFTNIQIRNLLQNTANDLGIFGRDIYYGFGLVDARLN